MNELDLVRGFRNELSGPGPETVARARALLLAPPPALSAEASPDRAPVAATRRRRRHLWSRPLIRVGVAVAASLALMVASTSGLFRPQHANPALAAEVDAATRAAVARPDQGAPVAGRYWYTKVEASHLSYIDRPGGEQLRVLQPELVERWVAADGSGRMRTTSRPPIHVTEAERARWEAARKAPWYHGSEVMRSDPDQPHVAPPVMDERLGPGGFGGVDLPSSGGPILAPHPSPEARYQTIAREARAQRRGGGGISALIAAFADALRPDGTNRTMFALVVQAALTPGVPPKVAAELYRAAARIPGIELIEHTTDPVGRPGMALAMTDATGIRSELIFDPATGRPLGERQVQVRQDYSEPGTIFAQQAVLASGPVDSVDAIPGP